jgi:uncharacterized membrane protein
MSLSHAETTERFQLERLVLFSDAVFAIAITLLAIELKVPELHGPEATEPALGAALRELAPKFLGFVISFLLIGIYWTRHHAMFAFVRRATPRLLGLNLLFLFTIVLMPFTTGFFGAYSRPSLIHLKSPVILYGLNIVAIGLTSLAMWNHIASPRHGARAEGIDEAALHDSRVRAIVVPGVFGLLVVVACLDAAVARYVPLVAPLANRLAARTLRRPAAKAAAH